MALGNLALGILALGILAHWVFWNWVLWHWVLWYWVYCPDTLLKLTAWLIHFCSLHSTIIILFNYNHPMFDFLEKNIKKHKILPLICLFNSFIAI